MDSRVLRLMIVHNITPGTYAAARALRNHVHATIGVSARIRDDLVRRMGFAADRTLVIANAVDTHRFADRDLPAAGTAFRALSLGRVEDYSKGIFWLPKIMECLADTAVHLKVAGDGPDLPELRRRCAGLEDRIQFLGVIPPAAVPEVLSQHDILLFPSRFEGLPLTLVEAMAAGCVPVASCIRGVTDFVITSGEDGLLFPVGDIRTAAEHIRTLATNRALLSHMSAAAQRMVRERFSTDAMVTAYAAIVNRIKAAPPAVAEPLPLRHWRYPRGLKPGLRTYLPLPLKNALRALWAGV